MLEEKIKSSDERFSETRDELAQLFSKLEDSGHLLVGWDFSNTGEDNYNLVVTLYIMINKMKRFLGETDVSASVTQCIIYFNPVDTKEEVIEMVKKFCSIDPEELIEQVI